MKKTALFLYLALGLFSCCKDKELSFEQSSILQVETQNLDGGFAEQKSFVFLSNKEHKVIGHTEVSNYGTFEIQNDIPYDGGAFDVHIVYAFRDASNEKWRFHINSYTKVDAPKIYIKSKEDVEPVSVGEANFHVAVPGYYWYNIKSSIGYANCSNAPTLNCPTDFSMSLGSTEDAVLASFYFSGQDEFRYGLLTSVKVGDNITLTDADLPYHTTATQLDFAASDHWSYFFYGYIQDGQTISPAYNLNFHLTQTALVPLKFFVPDAVFQKFSTSIVLYNDGLGENYSYSRFGAPVTAYHPQPADFELSVDEKTATLTQPGMDISYYRLFNYKNSNPNGDIEWFICSDLAQPFTIPEFPKDVRDMMTSELRNKEFKFTACESVKDTRYATYQDYLNAVLISGAPVDEHEDYSSESKKKKF